MAIFFYKRQELLTLRGWPGSTSVFGGIRLVHSFLCYVILFCSSSSCVLCTQCC